MPELAKRVNELNAETILDYGCGEGHLFDFLSLNENHLYDLSSDMLSIAKDRIVKNSRNFFHKQITMDLFGRFDVVVLSLVLITMSSKDEIISSLREVKSLLKPTGKLLIGTTHPCFRDQEFSTFFTDFNMDNYFNEFTPLKVSLKTFDEPILITDYHKSLGFINKQIEESGLSISKIEELKDIVVGPFNANTKVPPYLILECSIN
ncbi:MAG: class I SAM-dependent methyltransferase [Cyclobacteriaceae bacterium]